MGQLEVTGFGSSRLGAFSYDKRCTLSSLPIEQQNVKQGMVRVAPAVSSKRNILRSMPSTLAPEARICLDASTDWV